MCGRGVSSEIIMIKDKSLSIVGFLNFFIFQWFFIRIAILLDPPTDGFKIIRRPYYILKWIFPLTGWFGIPYYPKKYRMILLSKGMETPIES